MGRKVVNRIKKQVTQATTILFRFKVHKDFSSPALVRLNEENKMLLKR